MGFASGPLLKNKMPQSYEQSYQDLQQAIVMSDMSHKKEEMILNDKPLFSKNYIDDLKGRYLFYVGAAAIIGFIIGDIFNRI